jgi:putative peptide zinc metalloprotease protein
MRLSAQAVKLWPILRTGVRLSEMVVFLRSQHPANRDIDAQVAKFVEALAAANMLADSPRPKQRPIGRAGRILDRLASVIARPLMVAPRLSTAIAIFLAALAIVIVAKALALPRPSAMLTSRTFIAFFGYMLFVTPLHELAHAVVARAAGLRISECGFMIRGVPRPYVAIPRVAAASRRQRVAIALAGPFVDLVACAIASFIVINGRGGDASAAIIVWSLATVLTSMSPLTDGDGCHALSAALNDELARRSALGERSRLTHRRTVRVYRLAIVLHVVIVVTALAMVIA